MSLQLPADTPGVYTGAYIHRGCAVTVKTAKLFKNGGSQAVRLPKEFRIEGDEVIVRKVGHSIVLTPKAHIWDEIFAIADRMSPDLFDHPRDQGDYPVRGPIFP